MKNMSITYHNGNTAVRSGYRIIHSDQGDSPFHHGDDDKGYFGRSSSTQIKTLIEQEANTGRLRWAQLVIEIDNVPLAFWLPAELEIYCDVFAMVPFPTAKTLLARSPGSLELNSHWLSRLPKQAKATKFRERFLRYVQSKPPALKEFYEFYRNDD